MNDQVPLRIRLPSLDSASQATLWALLLQRQRRCGPFCFNDSDAAESSDAVGPSASATVDKFEAVPGHSFLVMLRDATLFSACNHREKAESSYQPPSTWEAKVSCAWLLYIIIHLKTCQKLPIILKLFPVPAAAYYSQNYSSIIGACLVL